MTPASLSSCAMAATPLPCLMLTVTSVPGLPLPWISLRANSTAAPAASTSNSTTASKIFTAPPFFFGAVCLSLCAIRTFLCCFSASQPSSIRRI